MIYQLNGFSGKAEVMGELREFSYEDGELTILGITIQDARNILGILATGQAGAPLTYGAAVKEIINTGAPGPVALSIVSDTDYPDEPHLNAVWATKAIEAGGLVASKDGTKYAYVPGSTPGTNVIQAEPVSGPFAIVPKLPVGLYRIVYLPRLVVATSADAAPASHPPSVVPPATKPAEPEKAVAAKTVEAKEEPAKERPAARRAREPKDQAAAIQAHAAAVEKEVTGVPVQPQQNVFATIADGIAAMTTAAPGAAESAKDVPKLDPKSLPAWLTGAKTMRVLVTEFDRNMGLRDADSIIAACAPVKDLVPFFGVPNFRERLSAAIDLIFGAD